MVTKRISDEALYRWFNKAKLMAAEAGTPLGLSPKNALHGLRSNRKTELIDEPVKYSRFLTEAAVLSGNPGITVHEGRYQGLVPPDLAKAVRVEAPIWGDGEDNGDDDE